MQKNFVEEGRPVFEKCKKILWRVIIGSELALGATGVRKRADGCTVVHMCK